MQPHLRFFFVNPVLCIAFNPIIIYHLIEEFFTGEYEMKKIFLIFLIVVCLFIQHMPLASEKTLAEKTVPENKNGNEPVYRFEYVFHGQTSGVFLLIFRYRFLFRAIASVLLNVSPLDAQTMQFSFKDISDTGYLIRTWGFSGKTLITSAADYDQAKVQRVLASDRILLQEKAASFAKTIKKWMVFPFAILSKDKNAVTFKRSINGVHRDSAVNLPMKSLKVSGSYNYNFKIYHILNEMLKAYNQPFFEGTREQLLALEPGRQWLSPKLDFSEIMNRIGGLATPLIGKYVKFRQSSPIQLTYRVTLRTADKLTIKGTASPGITIYSSFKVIQVTRAVELRLPDGVLLDDSYYIEIGKENGKSGTARCSLRLVQ